MISSVISQNMEFPVFEENYWTADYINFPKFQVQTLNY